MTQGQLLELSLFSSTPFCFDGLLFLFGVHFKMKYVQLVMGPAGSGKVQVRIDFFLLCIVLVARWELFSMVFLCTAAYT